MDSFEELLAKARTGSPGAWDQLWTQYGPHLLRVARRRLSRHLQAKAGESDLVQETCWQAHQDFHQFQGQTEGELKAWFAHILLDNITDFERRYREGKKRSSVEESLAQKDPLAPTLSPPAQALEEMQPFRGA